MNARNMLPTSLAAVWLTRRAASGVSFVVSDWLKNLRMSLLMGLWEMIVSTSMSKMPVYSAKFGEEMINFTEIF